MRSEIAGHLEFSLITILFSKSDKEDCVEGGQLLQGSHAWGVVITAALFLELYHSGEATHPLTGRFWPSFLSAPGEQNRVCVRWGYEALKTTSNVHGKMELKAKFILLEKKKVEILIQNFQ